MASHRGPECTRVQDAYSLRCAPQVAGAARDTVDHAALVAGRELASAIDNPVITSDGRVESNGNFHGAPLGYVLDFLAIVTADVASMSERRTDRFLDVARSHGLNAFLADDPGVDSGHMIAQYTQAAIVSELKRLAAPASVDSIPSSAMQEDHVSMGWSAARKLRRAIDGLTRVLAIELLTAARALRDAGAADPSGRDRRGGSRAPGSDAGARPGPVPGAGDRGRGVLRRRRPGAARRRDGHRPAPLNSIARPPCGQVTAGLSGTNPPVSWPPCGQVTAGLSGTNPPVSWPPCGQVTAGLSGTNPPVSWPPCGQVTAGLSGTNPPVSWPPCGQITGGRPAFVIRQTVRQEIALRSPGSVRQPSAKPFSQVRRAPGARSRTIVISVQSSR